MNIQETFVHFRDDVKDWVTNNVVHLSNLLKNHTENANTHIEYRELTRAEYDALPDSKYSDGVMYCITDEGGTSGGGGGSSFDGTIEAMNVLYDGKLNSDNAQDAFDELATSVNGAVVKVSAANWVDNGDGTFKNTVAVDGVYADSTLDVNLYGDVTEEQAAAFSELVTSMETGDGSLILTASEAIAVDFSLVLRGKMNFSETNVMLVKDVNAGNISFDNTVSGLNSDNIQDAFDEMYDNMNGVTIVVPASGWVDNGDGTFKNTVAVEEITGNEILDVSLYGESTEEQIEAFGKSVIDIESQAGQVVFTASEAISVNLDIVLRGKIDMDNKAVYVKDLKASDIAYDNSESGLTAENMNAAVNEINNNLGGLSFGKDGEGNVGYFGADGSLIPFRGKLSEIIITDPAEITNIECSNGTVTKNSVKKEEGFVFLNLENGTWTVSCLVDGFYSSKEVDISRRTINYIDNMPYNLFAEGYGARAGFNAAGDTNAQINVSNNVVTLTHSQLSYAVIKFYSEGTIDLTNYKRLYIDAAISDTTPESNWSACFGIATKRTTFGNTGEFTKKTFITANGTRGTFSVDISEYSGEYYIGYYGVGAGSIYNFWLE